MIDVGPAACGLLAGTKVRPALTRRIASTATGKGTVKNRRFVRNCEQLTAVAETLITVGCV